MQPSPWKLNHLTVYFLTEHIFIFKFNIDTWIAEIVIIYFLFKKYNFIE